MARLLLLPGSSGSSSLPPIAEGSFAPFWQSAACRPGSAAAWLFSATCPPALRWLNRSCWLAFGSWSACSCGATAAYLGLQTACHPASFPASVQLISMLRYGMLHSMPWLPARPLLGVAVDAIAADLRGPQPQQVIEHLSLAAQLGLLVSVQALSCFDCQRLELESAYGVPGSIDRPGIGTVALQRSATDIEQWTHWELGMQAILRPRPASPLQERLASWGLALHPLFSSHAGLQTVRLVGASLQLAFPAEEVEVDDDDFAAGGWVSWPPAQLTPSADALSSCSEAADLTAAGLSLSLRLGSRPGTLELTARRSAAQRSRPGGAHAPVAACWSSQILSDVSASA